MKTVLHIAASLAASFVVFLVAALATVFVVLAIHGEEPFEPSTKAAAALAGLIVAIGLPLAIAAFLLILSWLHNREKAAATGEREKETPLAE